MTACQCIPAVTNTENNDTITNLRKCQDVGLVLGDEYTPHGEHQATKANRGGIEDDAVLHFNSSDLAEGSGDRLQVAGAETQEVGIPRG